MDARDEAARHDEQAGALARSEQRYRAALAGSLDAFWLMEAVRGDDGAIVDFVCEDVNQRGAAMIGRPREEIVGRRLSVLLPRALAERLVAQWSRVLATNEPVEEEFSYTADTQETRWIRNQAVPADGGVAVMVRDVTDRVRTVEELRLAARALDAASEGIVLTRFDGEALRIVSANRGFERMTGYTEAEARDRSIRILQGPATDPAIVDQVRAAVVAGMGLVATLVSYRSDGTPFWNQFSVSPVVDEDGATRYFVGVLRDVTDRLEVQRALNESEEHYRRLFELAPYGIYALDADGCFTELNEAAEEILQRPAAEVFRLHFSEVVDPADLATAEQAFRSVVAGDADDLVIELHIVRPTGERRLLTLTVTSLRADGRSGLYGIARDVTDERVRMRHLRRIERLASIGTLVSGVAHELNNPLTSIKSFSQLMLYDEHGPELREALEIIHREADRAARVVADLRTLARGSQDVPRSDTVDLNEIARHVVRLRAYALSTHAVELREDLAEALPPVRGARSELEQVVINLVVNAEQAMTSGWDGTRRLILRTRASDTGVVLSVVDSGPGIAAEHLARIFDPFWTTKPPGEGTGLGLSLVHSIVTEHGGSIHVESEPGRGAAFTLMLPPAGAAGPVAQRRGDEPARPARALRALVVDDEEPVRRILSLALERRGHHVTLAADGAAALERLGEVGERGFDVILSDLRMPGMGGEALLHEIRRLHPAMEPRLIFVTGDAASPDAARVVAGTCARLLVKPFDIGELIRVVEAEP